MTDSTYRVQVKAAITDLQTNVAQLATNAVNPPIVHYTKPPAFPADGPHLAVWFEDEVLFPGGPSSRQPTGSRLYGESYQLRYWEPDPNYDASLAVDESAQNDLQNLYRSVFDRCLVGTNWYPSNVNNIMAVIPVSGAVTPEAENVGTADQAAFVRGFALAFVVQRWHTLG